MRNLDPFESPQLTDRQMVALLRLTEERMEDGDERHLMEAIFKISQPFPNTHTENTHDTAFLNGRKEVNTMIYDLVARYKLEVAKSEQSTMENAPDE